MDWVIDVSTAPPRLYLLLALPLVLLLILFLDPVSHEKALPHFNKMRQPALARPFSTYPHTGIFLDYFPVFNYYCVQYFSFRYRCSGEYNSHKVQDLLYSLELNKFPGEGLSMTLKQLIYVLKVAEVGNMTEAASRLFIAQPSLTHAISELEKELGITIFIRTNRGITTTREGDEFLGYARNVIEQADLLEERYKRGHKGTPPLCRFMSALFLCGKRLCRGHQSFSCRRIRLHTQGNRDLRDY